MIYSRLHIFQSEVLELVLVGAHEFDLLCRHLILGIFIHDAVAHNGRAPTKELIIIISCAIFAYWLQ